MDSPATAVVLKTGGSKLAIVSELIGETVDSVRAEARAELKVVEEALRAEIAELRAEIVLLKK